MDEVRTVAPDEWVTSCAEVYSSGLAFDWLSACDEIGQADELRIVVRFDRPDGTGTRIETRVPRNEPRLATLRRLIAGAAWHERETQELFGVVFTGQDGESLPAEPLLLPAEGTAGHPGGHPLRKDYVLAARAVTPWPADAGGAEDARRRQSPPGVPDPSVWGDRPADSGPPDSEQVAAGGRRRR